MSTASSNDLVWADEIHAEGHAEGVRDGVVRLLVHRGVDEDKAKLIAAALVEHGSDAATERAAYDGLDELLALAAEQ
jgi:hypothetical protein